MDKITHDSGAVQSYLEILQGIVNRMAANSAHCKTWCITLVSAIVVVITDKTTPELIWVALVPVALFLFLDAYYLGLEQRFRGIYNTFIKKLHSGEAQIDDIYLINPGGGFGKTMASTIEALCSLSVWPFYGLLIAMLGILQAYIL